MATVTVGRVLSAHGIKGGCKCAYHTDYPERLLERKLYVLRDPSSNEIYTLTADVVRLLNESFLINFLEIAQREKIMLLRNWLLEVSSERVPAERGDGEFYFYELQGLQVYDADGILLGEVVNVFRGVNQEVLEVGALGKETVLIPFAAHAIAKVEIEQRRIILQSGYRD